MKQNGIKKRYNFLFTLVVLLSFGLVQCSPAKTAVSTRIPEDIATMTATVAITPTPTFTQTHFPTIIQTPSPTSTPSPLPTLNPEERKSAVLALMSSDGGCDLPCWWGITPGKTTKSDAIEVIRKLNLGFMTDIPMNPNVAGFIEYVPKKLPNGWLGIEGTFSSRFVDGSLEENIDVKIYDNYVKFISIDFTYLPDQAGISFYSFKHTLAALAPEKVVPQLGIPSEVRIDPSFGPGEGISTYAMDDIYIFYDQQGIILQYFIRNHMETKNRICPIFGSGGNTMDIINLLLTSPNEGIPVEVDSAEVWKRAIPIDKAVGITPQDFYNLFIQTSKPICFNTIPEIWP